MKQEITTRLFKLGLAADNSPYSKANGNEPFKWAFHTWSSFQISLRESKSWHLSSFLGLIWPDRVTRAKSVRDITRFCATTVDSNDNLLNLPSNSDICSTLVARVNYDQDGLLGCYTGITTWTTKGALWLYQKPDGQVPKVLSNTSKVSVQLKAKPRRVHQQNHNDTKIEFNMVIQSGIKRYNSPMIWQQS